MFEIAALCVAQDMGPASDHERPPVSPETQLMQLRAVILLATCQIAELDTPEMVPLCQAILTANHLVRALLTSEQTQEALSLTRRLKATLYTG